MLRPSKIFLVLAEIIEERMKERKKEEEEEEEENGKKINRANFIGLLIQILNVILLTSEEFLELRTQLKMAWTVVRKKERKIIIIIIMMIKELFSYTKECNFKKAKERRERKKERRRRRRKQLRNLSLSLSRVVFQSHICFMFVSIRGKTI